MADFIYGSENWEQKITDGRAYVDCSTGRPIVKDTPHEKLPNPVRYGEVGNDAKYYDKHTGRRTDRHGKFEPYQ